MFISIRAIGLGLHFAIFIQDLKLYRRYAIVCSVASSTCPNRLVAGRLSDFPKAICPFVAIGPSPPHLALSFKYFKGDDVELDVARAIP